MEVNLIVIRDPKSIYFDFDRSKDEIEFIRKSNVKNENKIKNEIEQLLSKYKHRNNIHEHGKQQNGGTT